MDIVAFIPVRGGSKSIPSKNIRPLLGRPLVHWVMRAALDCSEIEKVYVASDDPHIREVAARISDPRAAVIERDPATATDDAPTESALLEFARKHAFRCLVLLQATSPLTSGKDLTEALRRFNSTGADSLLSGTRQHRFLWESDPEGRGRPKNYRPDMRPRRQDWPGEFIENGAFYITSREGLLASGSRLSGRISLYEMDPETSIELDEPYDWMYAEQVLRQREISRFAERCRPASMLVMDVDGVMTDAGMYYGPRGEVLKKFNTRDGMGLALWKRAGFRTAIITSEDTPIVGRRALKLGVDCLRMGVSDKASVLDAVLKETGTLPEQVVYIGDDVNDLPVLTRVGFFACPADAHESIQRVAHFVCTAKGGQGCVREVIDLILQCQESGA